MVSRVDGDEGDRGGTGDNVILTDFGTCGRIGGGGGHDEICIAGAIPSGPARATTPTSAQTAMTAWRGIGPGPGKTTTGPRRPDHLLPGAGEGLLSGGADAAVFVLATGTDILKDPAIAEGDRIDLRVDAGIFEFNELSDDHMTRVGAGGVSDDPAGRTLTLRYVTLSALGAGGVIF